MSLYPLVISIFTYLMFVYLFVFFYLINYNICTEISLYIVFSIDLKMC